MSFPGLTDISTSSIDSRTREIADNVTKNNAVLARLRKKGKIKPFSGGEQIVQEFSFQENPNAGWYSGYDLLSVGAADVISGAKFAIKQIAVPVTISGLEELQNDGKERMIDLLESRQEVAENTLANQMSQAIYGDGTASGGKSLTGLGAAAPTDPTTGTYGTIDRAAWAFWRSQILNSGALTPANIQAAMIQFYTACVRGSDMPDMIVADNNFYATYYSALMAQQRFVDVKEADGGFASIKFMTADVVLDGGIGGFADANTAFYLNTKYIFLRPHTKRDFVALSPRRFATNQDAAVSIIAWAGNMTSNGAQFIGRLNAN